VKEKVKKANPANPELIKTIRLLRKSAKENDAKIWRKIAEALTRTRRKRIAVNISRVNRYTKEGETVAVPGKVLAAGEIDHPIIVSAFAFSESSVTKIKKAKGKCISYAELIKKNPKGTGVRIIG
jgi:large subunit ribosomal protein L18e